MPIATFTPSLAPSPGALHAQELNILEADFGDGYSLAAPAGLNHIRRVITLRWDACTPDVLAELDDFFASRGGYEPFLYQPYGFATPLKWTCREWSAMTTAPHTFTAKLRQSFCLVS
ncbi:phage tail protein [Mameliella sp. AT18]|uniref:phage tail protein n=1 Tax=Mameliella sp. AT18 TaxID=3028385 RepID=UPI00237C0F72|nr:phage tail protein [Mameliella sp. AT18]MDD9730445.1 phage tail protein [Mameliella sp. AT18]